MRLNIESAGVLQHLIDDCLLYLFIFSSFFWCVCCHCQWGKRWRWCAQAIVNRKIACNVCRGIAHLDRNLFFFYAWQLRAPKPVFDKNLHLVWQHQQIAHVIDFSDSKCCHLNSHSLFKWVDSRPHGAFHRQVYRRSSTMHLVQLVLLENFTALRIDSLLVCYSIIVYILNRIKDAKKILRLCKKKYIHFLAYDILNI